MLTTMLPARRQPQRSQAMPEFALVAPILFLIIFGIFDFGHGIYEYVTIQTAANEAARVALQGSSDLGGSAYSHLDTATIFHAAKVNTAGINIVQPPSCPNGPIPSLADLSTQGGTHYIPANTGWLYVSAPAQVSQWAAGTCASQPGGQNAGIQVTIVYHFSPLTPLIGNVIGNHLFFPIYSVYRSEY